MEDRHIDWDSTRDRDRAQIDASEARRLRDLADRIPGTETGKVCNEYADKLTWGEHGFDQWFYANVECLTH